MNDIGAVRRRLARLAWLLDQSIAIPGTRVRIGFDPILGLIPGIGDVIGVLLSTYIVREAAQLGAPPSVLARMVFNVALEAVVGIVPIVGDVFDAAWKANQRNVALLEDHLANPRRTVRASRLFLALLAVGMIAVLAVTIVLAALIVRGLWQLIAS